MENLSILRKILKLDWLLIFMIILLVFIGCLSLYSAAGGDWNPWASRHFQRSIIGFSLAFVIAITDIKIIYKYAWLPFIISISFIIGTGFIKCIPINLSGKETFSASLLIEIEEVFDAKIVFFPHI